MALPVTGRITPDCSHELGISEAKIPGLFPKWNFGPPISRLPDLLTRGFLVVLDDAFQRAVGGEGITALQEQQIVEDSREAAVAILKRVDCEKYHNEYNDPEQWMKVLIAFLFRQPNEASRWRAG